LRAYLARLQHIAGQKPLLLAEAGADSLREGEDGQAAITAMHVRAAFEEGACGAIAFAWTDEWWRGGHPVEDWNFGLVDRERRPKPAAAAVAAAFADAPFRHARRSRLAHLSRAAVSLVGRGRVRRTERRARRRSADGAVHRARAGRTDARAARRSHRGARARLQHGLPSRRAARHRRLQSGLPARRRRRRRVLAAAGAGMADR